jgi:hypothetical protein
METAAIPAPASDHDSLNGDLIWGAQSIAKEIERTERQTYHLLETGRLPAEKVAGRWCSARSRLRKFFNVA